MPAQSDREKVAAFGVGADVRGDVCEGTTDIVLRCVEIDRGTYDSRIH